MPLSEKISNTAIPSITVKEMGTWVMPSIDFYGMECKSIHSFNDRGGEEA